MKDKYYEAIGRRKSATARVRLFSNKNKGEITINEKPLSVYLPIQELQESVKAPLKKTSMEKEFYISSKVAGGGLRAQAEAIRLGVSRALVKFQSDLRGVLKADKFLSRDARKKERRKPGLKKARKAPQWSKR
jgi:small subunit ribosomal protein S9